ncbi:MAG: carbon dioxide concentrating mechanism protein [Cyanobacteria bacterium P01_E01_bin.42]
MSLQPLQLANIPNVRIVGEVKIHPSAAIAPGAILQAAPNSQINIAAGACVGMGAILNAYGGAIELEAGVSLGAGVLIVGCSKIGANTCIGGATTIYNADLDALQVIPAGSVIGDPSRRVELISEPEKSLPISESASSEQSNEQSEKSEEIAESPTDLEIDDPWTSAEEEMAELAAETAIETPIEIPAAEVQKPSGVPVFGKVYVNQLLLTLFPERKINDFQQDEG